MKKLLLLIMMPIIVLCFSPVTYANSSASNPILVFVDSHRVVFDVDPIVENGRTLVQFRPIFLALGLNVSYDAETKAIVGSNDEYNIELTVGSNNAKVNNKNILLDSEPQIYKGFTMVPLRFITQAINTRLDFYPDKNRIIIGLSYNWNLDKYLDVSWNMSKADIMKAEKNKLVDQGLDIAGYDSLTYEHGLGYIIYSFDNLGLRQIYLNYSGNDFDNIYARFMDLYENAKGLYYSKDNLFNFDWDDDITEKAYEDLYPNLDEQIEAAISNNDLKLSASFGTIDEDTVYIEFSNSGSYIKPQYSVGVFYDRPSFLSEGSNQI